MSVSFKDRCFSLECPQCLVNLFIFFIWEALSEKGIGINQVEKVFAFLNFIVTLDHFTEKLCLILEVILEEFNEIFVFCQETCIALLHLIRCESLIRIIILAQHSQCAVATENSFIQSSYILFESLYAFRITSEFCGIRLNDLYHALIKVPVVSNFIILSYSAI